MKKAIVTSLLIGLSVSSFADAKCDYKLKRVLDNGDKLLMMIEHKSPTMAICIQNDMLKDYAISAYPFCKNQEQPKLYLDGTLNGIVKTVTQKCEEFNKMLDK